MDLEAFRELDFTQSVTTLWVFKKSVKPDGSPRFTGRWIETTDTLDGELQSVSNEEKLRITETAEYSLLAQTNENSALTIKADETHSSIVTAQMVAEDDAKRERRVSDIQNTVFYVAKHVIGDGVVFSVKKADSSWKTKKASQFISVVYGDQTLELESRDNFQLSKYVDFFVWGDDILVCNKGNFESIVNYKAAHKDNFIALQAEPEFSGIFSNLDPVRQYVGENKIQLRRAHAIQQKGHYRDGNFMANLRKHHGEFGLNLNFNRNGQLIPCATTCKDIFQALLDHRLRSGFSRNVYDVQDASNINI